MIRTPHLKRLFATLLIGLTFSLTATLSITAWTATVPVQSHDAAGDLERHARYLASEALTGRGVDTPGVKLARDYIAAEFAKYGLRPGGAGGYLQSFEVAIGVQIKEPSSLRLAQQPLPLNRQWIPLGLSTSGKVEGELVFVGYGITAKEYGYDDYAGVDVKNKIVLVLRYEPPPRDAASPFKTYPDYSTHSALRTKANNARDHGAAGMILVDLHESNDSQELISTRTSLWRGGRSLVAAQVNRSAVEQTLAGRGIALAGLKEQIDRSGKPASRALGIDAALEVTLEEDRAPADNVVAVLPGSDPRRAAENIVIGAHYDHLGFGHFGAFDPRRAGTIHPGADDNASGTAVLLDLARRLAQSPARPARTIVFVAFSAEELGLYGSRHFVRSDARVSATQAMLNLDMVGRLRDDRITVFGARSGHGVSEIVSRAATRLGLKLNESDDVGRSDHLSFYNRRIPVLHFFTGVHQDYHRSTDTADKLNYPGMAKVSDLVMAIALELANKQDDLQFVALPSRSPGRQPGNAALNAYLGSIPDYGTDAAGVQLAGVVAGSPAALAGLRAGDVIIRLADERIQTIEDLTTVLSAQKPGDEIEIVALRAGTQVSFKATLQSRSSDRSRS